MTQDPKKVTPEQIAELRAALAKATPGPWRTFAGVNDDGVWAACGPEHAADYDADETNEPGDVAEQAAQRDAELIALMRNALPSLLDAAERCARLSESIGLKFNGESVAVPAIDIIENVAVQLASAIARAEAAEKERDEIVSVIIGHDDEDMKHDPKSVAQLVKDVLIERDDLARRLGEATAALLALRKWVDEYSDLVERSKRWVHDSTMWETSSYPELAKEWQALWSRYPESVIDINTTPPADLAAVRGACALALRWLGDPDDPNGTFEDIGAWYQRETGRLRPGKSLPMAMAGVSDEDREKHFCAWADAKGREVRAALKSAGGASRTERGDHAKGGG